MTSRNEIFKNIAQRLANEWRADPTYQVAQSDQFLYLRTRDQVFRVAIEELDQIETEQQAADFMATLAYPCEPQ